jgi:methylmalonyl-CoA mutase cobalamin-binding subunit
LVVAAGVDEPPVRSTATIIESLEGLGIDAVDAGRVDDPSKIAAMAAAEGVDAVELCVPGGGGVLLPRRVMHALTAIGQREVSIVVRRVR